MDDVVKYKNTGAIHTDRELDHYLDEVQRLKRIKIEEMNDATDRGFKGKRKVLLDQLIKLDHEEQQIEKQIKALQPKQKKVVFHGRIFKNIDVSDVTEQMFKQRIWDDDGYIEYQYSEEGREL